MTKSLRNNEITAKLHNLSEKTYLLAHGMQEDLSFSHINNVFASTCTVFTMVYENIQVPKFEIGLWATEKQIRTK